MAEGKSVYTGGVKKLIKGVVEFREKVRPSMLGKFEQLALGQKPDVLLVACSDSRVAVNVFASTDPGDMFVLRNVGNIVPPQGSPHAAYFEGALDFALSSLDVRHIVICGHSECGAMIAIQKGLGSLTSQGLKDWLKDGIDGNFKSVDYNSLSQENVLLQLEHLKTYPQVRERLREGRIMLHGWFFNIKTADVYHYSFDNMAFELLDAEHAEALLKKL